MTPPRRLPPEDEEPGEEPEAPASSTSMVAGLPVDPGPAVRTDGKEEPPADDAPEVVEVLGPEVPGPVTTEQAIFLMRAVWGVAHHATRLTGGPDDAFQPSMQELRDQAAPLAEIAGRYPWLALVIQKSPYLAAAVTIGGYAGGEIERVADHRRGVMPQPSPGVTPATPPAPASFVRSSEQAPSQQSTEYGIGLREAPRPGPAPGVSRPT